MREREEIPQVAIPEVEIPEVREEIERAESLRRSRIEAAKDALLWAWVGITVVGGGAMSFGRGNVQLAGAAIFLINMAAPGALMAKDIVKGIADKWQGKSLNSQEKAV